MYHIVIPYSHIESRPYQHIQLCSLFRLIFGCHAVTNYSNMLIRQAGEELACHANTNTTRAFPSHGPTEDAILHVKRAVIIAGGLKRYWEA